MRWPRLTLRTLMLIVALCAINGGVIRFGVSAESRGGMALGLLLALNTVVIVSIRRWLRTAAKVGSATFRDAFLAVGWSALILCAAVFLPKTGSRLSETVLGAIGTPFIYVMELIFPSLGYLQAPPLYLTVLLTAIATIYLNLAVSGPVLAVAACAGFAAVSYAKRAGGIRIGDGIDPRMD